MVRLSSVLFTCALICALVLAVIYQQTAPRIEKQKQLTLDRSLQAVLAAQSYQRQEQPVIHYVAYDSNGGIIGWCLLLSGKGYGGKMQLLVGVDKDKKITGIKILEHKETPGLGSKINEAQNNQPQSLFLRQFAGKPAEELILAKGKDQKNIQAITGATISSKAVTSAVKEGIEKFFKERQ